MSTPMSSAAHTPAPYGKGLVGPGEGASGSAHYDDDDDNDTWGGEELGFSQLGSAPVPTQPDEQVHLILQT